MNNPRLKGVVNSFGTRMELGNELQEQEQLSLRFQYFANYLLLKKTYFDINGIYPYESRLDFDLLQNIDFDVKGERNYSMAVDGCFIIFKKNILHLELDGDEIDDFFKNIEDEDLNIVLIQTKSGNIDTTDLSTLTDCLNTNFTSQNKWSKFTSFKSKCEKLIQAKPQVNIKFFTLYVSGNAIDNNLLQNETFIVREKSLLQSMKNYFWICDDKYCIIDYYDESRLYKEYEKQVENSKVISETLIFEQITDSIDCHDYGEIRVGVISIREILKILKNKQTNLPNELYGYNVRDNIDKSKVNPQIKDTLNNNREMFLLLNNGITMVVDKQDRRGDKGVYLENIRIVNGCQTSHAIMAVSETNTDCLDAKVSIKIIKTEKEDILGKITYSSNNQNPVDKANLFAIESSIFDLEKEYNNFFLAYPNTRFKNVQLERRQGQFSNLIDKPHIDMLAQAKAYISLWLETPHEALMYAEQSLDNYKKQINQKYFVEKSLFSGILWYTIHNKIPKLHYNARFQIYSCIVLKILEEKFVISNVLEKDSLNTIRCPELIECLKLYNKDIIKEIDLVCKAIDNLSDDFPKLTTGKIHYRKFYPATVLSKIYNEYSKIRHNASNLSTNTNI